MNKTNLLQQLAPIGVAAIAATAGSMLVAPSAQAQIIEGCGEYDFSDWVDSDGVLCGDKLFEYVASTNLPTGPLPGEADLPDEVEFNQINPLAYEFVYLFEPSTPVSDFTLEYTVEIVDPLKPLFDIVEVDIDSDVVTFPPNEVLTATYTPLDPAGPPVVLESINGSQDPAVLPITPTNSVNVFNEYNNGGENGVIDAFQNSFQQERIHTVPEPATILGLLAVGGLGLGLKRKKQVS